MRLPLKCFYIFPPIIGYLRLFCGEQKQKMNWPDDTNMQWSTIIVVRWFPTSNLSLSLHKIWTSLAALRPASFSIESRLFWYKIGCDCGVSCHTENWSKKLISLLCFTSCTRRNGLLQWLRVSSLIVNSFLRKSSNICQRTMSTVSGASCEQLCPEGRFHPTRTFSMLVGRGRTPSTQPPFIMAEGFALANRESLFGQLLVYSFIPPTPTTSPPPFYLCERNGEWGVTNSHTCPLFFSHFYHTAIVKTLHKKGTTVRC